ncbi:uncharacterized protein [Centruroides vittatus]|uniref:uncharacterized protein n=1 Tax=Centruroides vittatus TaxID=120091 RepID=UPI00350F4AF8
MIDIKIFGKSIYHPNREMEDAAICIGPGCIHCLNCLFHPAMKLAKWFGVSGAIHEIDSKPGTRYNEKFERIYERTVMIILWIAFTEWFYRMMNLPPELSGEESWLQSYTIVSQSYLQAALSTTVFNLAGPRVKLLTPYRAFWDITRLSKFGVEDPQRTEKKIARYQKITCYFVFPFVIVGVMITESYIYYMRTLRFYPDSVWHIFLYVLMIIALYFAYTSWLSSAIFFIVVCKGLSRRFEEITNQLNYLYELQRANKPADNTFEPMQVKHFIGCRMVKVINKFLRWYIFTTYLVLIPGSCISLYQFTSPEQSTDSRVLLGIHTVLLVMTLLLTSLNAAGVSSAAHRPYEILHGLSLPNFLCMKESRLHYSWKD